MQRTEKYVKCYYGYAIRKIQNVGNSTGQIIWFLQQINYTEEKKKREGELWLTELLASVIHPFLHSHPCHASLREKYTSLPLNLGLEMRIAWIKEFRERESANIWSKALRDLLGFHSTLYSCYCLGKSFPWVIVDPSAWTVSISMAITMDWRQEATTQYSRQDVQPWEEEGILFIPTHPHDLPPPPQSWLH